MAYRQRNKGFQLDITHKGKRYRTQILGDITDAKAAEAHCEKGLNEGKIQTPTFKYNNVNNIIRDIICDNTGMCKC